MNFRTQALMLAASFLIAANVSRAQTSPDAGSGTPAPPSSDTSSASVNNAQVNRLYGGLGTTVPAGNASAQVGIGLTSGATAPAVSPSAPAPVSNNALVPRAFLNVQAPQSSGASSAVSLPSTFSSVIPGLAVQVPGLPGITITPDLNVPGMAPTETSAAEPSAVPDTSSSEYGVATPVVPPANNVPPTTNGTIGTAFNGGPVYATTGGIPGNIAEAAGQGAYGSPQFDRFYGGLGSYGLFAPHYGALKNAAWYGSVRTPNSVRAISGSPLPRPGLRDLGTLPGTGIYRPMTGVPQMFSPAPVTNPQLMAPSTPGATRSTYNSVPPRF